MTQDDLERAVAAMAAERDAVPSLRGNFPRVISRGRHRRIRRRVLLGVPIIFIGVLGIAGLQGRYNGSRSVLVAAASSTTSTTTTTSVVMTTSGAAQSLAEPDRDNSPSGSDCGDEDLPFTWVQIEVLPNPLPDVRAELPERLRRAAEGVDVGATIIAIIIEGDTVSYLLPTSLSLDRPIWQVYMNATSSMDVGYGIVRLDSPHTFGELEEFAVGRPGLPVWASFEQWTTVCSPFGYVFGDTSKHPDLLERWEEPGTYALVGWQDDSGMPLARIPLLPLAEIEVSQ